MPRLVLLALLALTAAAQDVTVSDGRTILRCDGEATVLAWSFTARGIHAEVRLTPQPQAQGIAAQ